MTDDDLYQQALDHARNTAQQKGLRADESVIVRYQVTEADGSIRTLLAEWPVPDPLPASHGSTRRAPAR